MYQVVRLELDLQPDRDTLLEEHVGDFHPF
jgi:hypothetical protein